MENSGPRVSAIYSYCSMAFFPAEEMPVDAAMTSRRGTALSKGRPVGRMKPSSRSAICATRFCTPMVIFFPHIGHLPPYFAVSEGLMHSPHFRCPSKWYFPCFQRMDMGRQVFKAFFDCVKPRKGAKQGKMGSPDMGRNINSIGAGLQHNFQQIPARKPQDGAPVGMDISNQLQPLCQYFCRFQAGKKQKVMYLSCPAAFL